MIKSNNEKTIIESKENNTFSYFLNYKILEQFPAKGAEGDIFRINKDSKNYILKLYKYGMKANEEIILKVKELHNTYPENLIKLIDIAYDDKSKRYYEIFEEAKFGNLKEYIKKNEITEENIMGMIKQVKDALNVLHNENILHLNLKPQNILIRSSDPFDVCLMDFGISSIFKNEMTIKMTNVKGNKLYCSPEAISGSFKSSSDYWSLGVIIYELITGKTPFQDIESKMMKFNLLAKKIEIPELINDEYTLLLKGLLTRNSDKRWGNKELSLFLDGNYNIKEYFDEEDKEPCKLPLEIGEKLIFSFDDFVNYIFLNSYSWTKAEEEILNGNVLKWLKGNKEIDKADYLNGLIDLYRNDVLKVIIKFIYRYTKLNDFYLYGKKITIESITEIIKNKRINMKLYEIIENKKIINYYDLYKDIVGVSYLDDLFLIINNLDLINLEKVLSAILGEYLIPKNYSVKFVIENIDNFINMNLFDEIDTRIVNKEYLLSLSDDEFIKNSKLILDNLYYLKNRKFIDMLLSKKIIEEDSENFIDNIEKIKSSEDLVLELFNNNEFELIEGLLSKVPIIEIEKIISTIYISSLKEEKNYEKLVSFYIAIKKSNIYLSLKQKCIFIKAFVICNKIEEMKNNFEEKVLSSVLYSLGEQEMKNLKFKNAYRFFKEISEESKIDWSHYKKYIDKYKDKIKESELNLFNAKKISFKPNKKFDFLGLGSALGIEKSMLKKISILNKIVFSFKYVIFDMIFLTILLLGILYVFNFISYDKEDIIYKFIIPVNIFIGLQIIYINHIFYSIGNSVYRIKNKFKLIILRYLKNLMSSIFIIGFIDCTLIIIKTLLLKDIFKDMFTDINCSLYLFYGVNILLFLIYLIPVFIKKGMTKKDRLEKKLLKESASKELLEKIKSGTMMEKYFNLKYYNVDNPKEILLNQMLFCGLFWLEGDYNKEEFAIECRKYLDRIEEEYFKSYIDFF